MLDAIYKPVIDEIRRAVQDDADRDARMDAVCEHAWRNLAEHGISWVGFYVDQPNEPDEQRLMLVCHRPKPACSPLAIHGVCGQTLRFGCTRVVPDVRDLGSDYIECDPTDRSEVAVPLFDKHGHCWGVFDVDSPISRRFCDDDGPHFRAILQAAGFLTD